MRNIFIISVILTVFLCAISGYAQLPELRAGVYIADGGAPLQVGLMSAPTVVDWNNDGKKDLVVGHFSYGRISLFLNQGTDADPLFNGGSLITSGGSAIQTTYG